MSPQVDVEDKVITAIKNALTEMSKGDVSVTRSSPVDSRLGLESLGWATVIVQLESELGVDPFRDGTAGSLQCVGDIVDLYRATLNEG